MCVFIYLQWPPYQVPVLLLFDQFLHDTMETVPMGYLVLSGFVVVVPPLYKLKLKPIIKTFLTLGAIN